MRQSVKRQGAICAAPLGPYIRLHVGSSAQRIRQLAGQSCISIAKNCDSTPVTQHRHRHTVPHPFECLAGDENPPTLKNHRQRQPDHSNGWRCCLLFADGTVSDQVPRPWLAATAALRGRDCAPQRCRSEGGEQELAPKIGPGSTPHLAWVARGQSGMWNSKVVFDNGRRGENAPLLWRRRSRCRVVVAQDGGGGRGGGTNTAVSTCAETYTNAIEAALIPPALNRVSLTGYGPISYG